MDTANPEAMVEKATIPTEEILRVVKDGDQAVADRNLWERKLRTWYSHRYGLRSKKTFPWDGASNLNIPLTDKIIRRLKPTFQSAVFRVNPVLSIEPLGKMTISDARSIEYGYDWLVRYRMARAREEMGYVEDAMLTYGFGVAKSVWCYECEKKTRTVEVEDFYPEDDDRELANLESVQLELSRRLDLSLEDHEKEITDAVRQFYDGAEVIEVSLTIDTYNAPRWSFVDPIDIIVPWDSSTEIDSLPWIVHRMYLSRRDLEVRQKSGMYNFGTKEIDELIGKTDEFGELEQRKSLREGSGGAGRKKGTQAEVWEVYFRYDLDGDGVSEPFVATVHKATSHVFRVVPYPYEHGQWPFTRFAMEANEPRWYASRGVPEMVHDLQVEINAQHNAKIDNMAIQNSKAFIYRVGSVRNPGQWRFRPGAMFPARRGPEDVREITHQPMDWSFNAEEENLRAWAEEYIGTPDFGISNINQRVERRTATEVEQIQASTGAVAEEQLERFQESMRRLHRQTLFLWSQYGDEQVEVRVLGSEAPVVFSRYAIMKDYDMVPTGKLDNLSPQARIAKASRLLSLAESQVAGVYINAYEVTRDIVENMDYRSAQRYLNEPGVFETNTVMEQVNEINVMRAIGEVHPVDSRDNHEIHAQVLQQSAQANADDPGLVILISAHLAMHLFFLGQQDPLNQLIDQGAQVQQVGTKLVMTLPQPQQQQAPQPQGEEVGVG